MAEPKHDEAESINAGRRRLLAVAGGSLAASALGGMTMVSPKRARAESLATIRWGVVGTGSIANSMARMMALAETAELVAVSSRRMETAKAFADKHTVGKAFDNWADMIAWDGVDAIYVATPTSVREEICVAAANGGKHVLGEKPFASLESVQRIAAACRANDVGFMDGTHFVHHPRTAQIRERTETKIGWPWSLDSAFQFNLPDRGNIRFNPNLEPMGAIGDAGWYNMRAAVEYLSPGIEIRSVSAYLRRDEETNAAISGSGVILFDDGSTTTWNCGFDSGAVVMDLRLTGDQGVIYLDNFLSNDQDGSASYTQKKGSWGSTVEGSTTVGPSKPGSVLMFEDFAAMVSDNEWREASINSTERTQRWLDAIWKSAVENES